MKKEFYEDYTMPEAKLTYQDGLEGEYLFKTAGFWHCYPSVWTVDDHNCWTEKQKIDDTVDAIIDACDALLDEKK